MGAALATAVFVAMSGTASASQSAILYMRNADWDIVGSGQFNADPAGSTPRDAIRACDRASDGWGVRVTIVYGVSGGTSERTTTTQGHNAPYCTSWKSGNIGEERSVTMTVCLAKGDQRRQCRTTTAYA